jgi:hypothetical protein
VGVTGHGRFGVLLRLIEQGHPETPQRAAQIEQPVTQRQPPLGDTQVVAAAGRVQSPANIRPEGGDQVALDMGEEILQRLVRHNRRRSGVIQREHCPQDRHAIGLADDAAVHQHQAVGQMDV